MFCLERCDCNSSSNRFAHQSIRNTLTNHHVLEHYILDHYPVFEAHPVDNRKFPAIPNMGQESDLFLWVLKKLITNLSFLEFWEFSSMIQDISYQNTYQL